MASNNYRCYLSGPFANTRAYGEEEKSPFILSLRTPGQNPGTHWVGPTAGRDVLEKILLPLAGIEPQLSAIHSVPQPLYAVRYSASHPS